MKGFSINMDNNQINNHDNNNGHGNGNGGGGGHDGKDPRKQSLIIMLVAAVLLFFL